MTGRLAICGSLLRICAISGVNTVCPVAYVKKRHEDILSFEELVEIVAAAAQLGIQKVRITGGEPLVRRGCVELVRMIAGIPGIEEVVMTTNGTLLGCYARDLKKAGLSRVNVSLDSLKPEKYAAITGGGRLSDALEGLSAAFDAGLTPVKVNTVLIGGFNDDEITDFVELTRRMPVELRFIELMPMGGAFGRNAYLRGTGFWRWCRSCAPFPMTAVWRGYTACRREKAAWA